MAKIKVGIEVPSGEHCDNRLNNICPMCIEDEWGYYYCAIFGDKLKIDKENDLCCIRCDKCKQAEELANEQRTQGV